MIFNTMPKENKENKICEGIHHGSCGENCELFPKENKEKSKCCGNCLNDYISVLQGAENCFFNEDCKCHIPTPPIASEVKVINTRGGILQNGRSYPGEEVKKECKHGNTGNCLGCYNETISHPENWEEVDKIIKSLNDNESCFCAMCADLNGDKPKIYLKQQIESLLSQAITTERNRIVAEIENICNKSKTERGLSRALANLLTQIKK